MNIDVVVALCCRYAFRLNSVFRKTIAIQFAVSMMVVCSNLYQMTKTTALNAVPLLLYMVSFLAQILIYCWYGNEVKLKVRVIKYTARLL